MTFSAFMPFALLVGLQWAGEMLCRALRLPMPGPVMGAVLLFVLMLLVPAVHAKVSGFSHTLLRNMLLFYVPASAGITKSFGDIAQHGLLLAGVIILSTWATALVSATILDALRNVGARLDSPQTSITNATFTTPAHRGRRGDAQLSRPVVTCVLRMCVGSDASGAIIV